MRTSLYKALIGIVSIILGTAGCFLSLNLALYSAVSLISDDMMMCVESLSTSTGPVESAGHIELPRSTKNLTVYFGPTKGMKYHCSHYIRFEMEPSDLDALYHSLRTRFRLLPLSIRNKSISSDSFPQNLGWKVDQITSFLSGTSVFALDYNQRILIDTTDPERYVVYAITDYED